MAKKFFVALFVLSFSFLLASCKSDKTQSTPSVSTHVVPVSVAKVKSEKVTVVYHSVGTVKSRLEPVIKTRLNARVQSVLVKEGDYVTEGQPLVYLSQEKHRLQLQKAKASLSSADAALVEKKSAMDRYGKLVEKGIISRLQYSEIIAQYKAALSHQEEASLAYQDAKLDLSRTTVASPIAGYVQEIKASVGEYVTVGSPLMKLINHQNLVAVLPFSQNKASHLKPGLGIALNSPVAPDQEVQEVITHIQPAINSANRAQMVLVNFQNPGNWKIGASVDANVYADVKENALLVPISAVVATAPGSYGVFVIKDNKAILKTVQLGYQLGEDVVVTSGVAKDDEVAVHGVHYLSNGSDVKIAERVDNKVKPKKLVHEVSAT